MSTLPTDKCGFCEKQGPDLKRCSKCHLTPYCSKQCQKKDWNRHKQWCEVLQGSIHPVQSTDREETDAKQPSTERGNPYGKKKRKKKKSEQEAKRSEPPPQDTCVCSWCQKVCDETLRCSRCKGVRYCSEVCQRKDWLNGHQKDCKAIAPIQSVTSKSESVSQNGAVGSSKETGESKETKIGEKERSNVCEWCQKYLDSPLRCSGCGKTVYCSETCQKKDWLHQHKQNCDRSRQQSEEESGKKDTKIEGPDPQYGAEEDKDKEVTSTACAWCQKYTESPLNCSGCSKVVYCSGECQRKDWITDHQKDCEGVKPKERVTGGPTGAERGELGTDECRYCRKGMEDMKRCARCKIAIYCSKPCQKSDWPRHKEECVSVDGIIKTKEFKKAERDEAQRAERAQHRLPMTPLEMMAQMMGLWPGPEEHRDASPRMSWAEARRITQARHPGFEIVESFDDLPGEFLWLVPVTRNRVLLAFISRLHHYHARHAVYIRDVNREETFVMFYLSMDNPFPFFSWRQVQPGNYICIQNAIFHNFLDGTVGIRVNDAATVKIL